MAARKTANVGLSVPRPANAQELLQLAWKLETISDQEGVPLKSFDIDYNGYHAEGFEGEGWDITFDTKI